AVVAAAKEAAADNSRVVSGCYEVGPNLPGVIMQLPELQPVVAADARVGRAAAGILIHEVVDDAAEVLLEVADVEGNVEFGGDEAGIGGIGDGAAALVADLEGGLRAEC